jgi:hypothetical protein
LTNDSELGRRLNNLIKRMPEFDNLTAEGSKRWTLPMAAAWFIWRDLAAVDDQWKIVTGLWTPVFDPPVFILSHHRREPGTLACVFQQAGFACGKRPYVSLEDINDAPSSETHDPYNRLRFALQSGRLRATIVQESPEDEGGLTEWDWGRDDWLDFDALADPSSAKNAQYYPLSNPASEAVLVSREEVLGVEAELSAAEAERLVWKLQQALGWIAYRQDQRFRSLGRIDMRPPTFFGRSYKSDRVESRPLAALTEKLLSGEVRAYVRGVSLTRAECISMLSQPDALWTQDLVFLPDEIREIWKRISAGNSKISGAAKDRALAELIEILKEAKRRNVRALSRDAKDWILKSRSKNLLSRVNRL